MTITTKQTPTTYRNFYLKRERVIHLFQDGSRKEGRAGGEAACSGLESSDRVDSTLSPGLCCAVSRLLGASSLNSSTVSLIYPAWASLGRAGLPVAVDTGFTVNVWMCASSKTLHGLENPVRCPGTFFSKVDLISHIGIVNWPRGCVEHFTQIVDS